MHGEYKIPGGKLVVIDLEIVGGHFANLMLSGDFFLAPDAALEWITTAIEGQPVSSSDSLLVERIQAATQSAEMLGLTPEGIVVAVRRAVGGV